MQYLQIPSSRRNWLVLSSSEAHFLLQQLLQFFSALLRIVLTLPLSPIYVDRGAFYRTWDLVLSYLLGLLISRL